MNDTELSASRQAITRACDLVGGPAILARRMKISQQRLYYYANKAKKVKAPMAIKIERATNGKVSRREIRPDIQGDW